MSIKIVTAPEYCYFPKESYRLFLAGGIVKCPDWQNEVIQTLKNNIDEDEDNVYVMNPRRQSFDPDDNDRQVEWEFDMIERCNIFTMFFCSGDSDQPVCMYELGRNIERMKSKFPDDWYDRIVISCQDGYRRAFDVEKQVSLATENMVDVNVFNGDTYYAARKHAKKISDTLKPLIDFSCTY